MTQCIDRQIANNCAAFQTQDGELVCNEAKKLAECFPENCRERVMKEGEQEHIKLRLYKVCVSSTYTDCKNRPLYPYCPLPRTSVYKKGNVTMIC